MHLYAFIAILDPKLVAMLKPFCVVCTAVSQMNSPIPQTLPQNHSRHWYVAYNWGYGHFCDILPILVKIWLPWQRPSDPCNQNCLLWIGRPRKPPLISNHILAISHRNAYICMYSNFSPKFGCYGNVPLSVVYRSVTDEFPDSTNRIHLKVWPFLWYFCLFGPKIGCYGNVP